IHTSAATIPYLSPLPLPRPPISTLFPFTTLFRSALGAAGVVAGLRPAYARAGEAQGRSAMFELKVTEVEFRRTSAGRQLMARVRSEEHTSELQSRSDLVCRLLLEKKKLSAACWRR